MGLYNFQTDNLIGPINYSEFENTGCGGREDDLGNWRVEFGACEYKGMHVYITGKIELTLSYNKKLGFFRNWNKRWCWHWWWCFSDGLSVMLHFASTGNSHPRKAQFSMVFVGIREYS